MQKHLPFLSSSLSLFLSISLPHRRPCLVILVPPPFRASFAPSHSPVSPLLHTFSLDPLAHDLPLSVSNTHRPSGGLVRGSILTAGVARTPILSVPANRRVSSKVSHHLCSSGHPRVTLHDHHPSSLATLFYTLRYYLRVPILAFSLVV